MTADQLAALLTLADAKEDDRGWARPKHGRNVTLHVAHSGVSLTVSRVEALRLEGDLLKARTAKGEYYLLCLEDVFAGAVEAPANTSRKAGFV